MKYLRFRRRLGLAARVFVFVLVSQAASNHAGCRHLATALLLLSV